MKTKKSALVLTVLGKDRPGLIAAVTGALFKEGCNLEDISMTVLEGELAMMMVVCLKGRAKIRLKDAFRKLQRQWGLDFFWKEMKGELLQGLGRKKKSRTFLISAIGRDRTGIVFKVSRILAGFGINITDLNSRILGKGPKTLYAMVLEAAVPDSFKVARLENALKQLARALQIEITLRPFERIEF